MRFENVKEVRIEAVNGRLNIKGWDEEHVELEYRFHGDDVKVETDMRNGTLTVVEKPRRKFFNLLGKDSWAEISLKVPKNVIVNARNVNGKLKARGVRFEEATTVNGEMHLEDCEAEKVSTVNGEIKAHLKVAGPLKASTVNGDLEITIEELEGDIDVSCVNGHVTLRLTDFCDARIVEKRVNGDVKLVGMDPNDPVIGTGEFTVKVSTVNGDVRVELI
ncbi:DUF4097 family beta strand repeat-containing protein [Thermococcus sp.]|uniref:DUF4097 family beta strand repeat-containing protein n=1 Tax=Thermococcus sp. TaxID=35749 RepID=UPI002613D038|nr:DUF4097 family beta strand repeat-containing protein [Thermococcus sp.]